jgi:hypothetical protein
MRPRPFLLLLAGFALALMAAGEADAEASHSPAEVDEGDTFLAWIDADEIYEEVKFYVCTLEEPYTCYAPQKVTRDEADANGDGSYRYSFSHQVGDGVYPGYRYELLEGENKTKTPAGADDQYPGLEVIDLNGSGSYYFKVERKAAPAAEDEGLPALALPVTAITIAWVARRR